MISVTSVFVIKVYTTVDLYWVWSVLPTKECILGAKLNFILSFKNLLNILKSFVFLKKTNLQKFNFCPSIIFLWFTNFDFFDSLGRRNTILIPYYHIQKFGNSFKNGVAVRKVSNHAIYFETTLWETLWSSLLRIDRFEQFFLLSYLDHPRNIICLEKIPIASERKNILTWNFKPYGHQSHP